MEDVGQGGKLGNVLKKQFYFVQFLVWISQTPAAVRNSKISDATASKCVLLFELNTLNFNQSTFQYGQEKTRTYTNFS